MNNHETILNPSYNPAERSDKCYDDLLSSIRVSFNTAISNIREPLFTTDANEFIAGHGDLYDIFLKNLPEDMRQENDCRACRNFVNRYGGLVRILDNGRLEPIMWGTVTGPYGSAVSALRQHVKNSKVTGVFFTSEKRFGTPKTGEWSHMSVDIPKSRQYRQTVMSVDQLMAEEHEDFKMLMSAIRKYDIKTVETAVNLLRSDALYRCNKVLGIAEWFLKVKQITPFNVNLIWKEVATCPAGFCHVSSSMIGTLLDDIEDGLDFEVVKRKFNEKMDPLHYMRPQVPPSAGNVARAEKIVAELGLENSLKRRFARLDEIETIWKPAEDTVTTESTGVFAGIKTKEAAEKKRKDIISTAVTMTWEKFRRTVLPNAKKIECRSTYYKSSYVGLVTADDFNAPPIILWDTEEHRNPFSWYMYSGGSTASQWNIPSSGYVEVTGITLQPNMWQPGYEHIGEGVIFILKGCKDSMNKSSGLFSEVMRGELREVRATIEAYSKSNALAGYDEASACGLCLQSGNSSWSCSLRVTTDVGVTVYNLDRWD